VHEFANKRFQLQNADQLKTAINIIVSRASEQAIAQIEAVGGTVTTRFYSPTAIKRVLRGDSHPSISLQADASFLSLAANPSTLGASLVAPLHAPDTPEEVKNEAMKAVLTAVGEKYKYRLPDATARKDIEYYRDPAHRGYLSWTVKDGESASLFFKPPGEAKDRKKQLAKRAAAKATADNRRGDV
jgi:large subunit ribosomal protein L15